MSKETETRLIYDIASCPMNAGIDMDQVIELYHAKNVAIYNSQQTVGCIKPEVVTISGISKVEVLDVSTEEGMNTLIEKLRS